MFRIIILIPYMFRIIILNLRVSLFVSETFGGVVVLARSISHHAEFVKPPGPKNP